MGAMGITPTMSLGQLLDEQPLHLTITGLAALSAFRLKAANTWVHGSNRTHLPGDLESALESLGAVDTIYSHHSRLPLRIPMQNIHTLQAGMGMKRDSLPDNGTNWYTDGSKLGDAAGAGYYDRKDEKDMFMSLGKHATVF